MGWPVSDESFLGSISGAALSFQESSVIANV